MLPQVHLALALLKSVSNNALLLKPTPTLVLPPPTLLPRLPPLPVSSPATILPALVTLLNQARDLLLKSVNKRAKSKPPTLTLATPPRKNALLSLLAFPDPLSLNAKTCATPQLPQIHLLDSQLVSTVV
jgi:hypothetical protein